MFMIWLTFVPLVVTNASKMWLKYFNVFYSSMEFKFFCHPQQKFPFVLNDTWPPSTLLRDPETQVKLTEANRSHWHYQCIQESKILSVFYLIWIPEKSQTQQVVKLGCQGGPAMIDCSDYAPAGVETVLIDSHVAIKYSNYKKEMLVMRDKIFLQNSTTEGIVMAECVYSYRGYPVKKTYVIFSHENSEVESSCVNGNFTYPPNNHTFYLINNRYDRNMLCVLSNIFSNVTYFDHSGRETFPRKPGKYFCRYEKHRIFFSVVDFEIPRIKNIKILRSDNNFVFSCTANSLSNCTYTWLIDGDPFQVASEELVLEKRRSFSRITCFCANILGVDSKILDLKSSLLEEGTTKKDLRITVISAAIPLVAIFILWLYQHYKNSAKQKSEKNITSLVI